VVSLWTPLLEPDIARRWFSWPNIAFLAPVPVITALLAAFAWRAFNNRRWEVAPFAAAIGLFVMSYLGIAISLWPMIVPYRFTLWQAASSPSTQAFHIHGVVILGVQGKGAGGHRVSLIRPARRRSAADPSHP
jgi:cytochrome d ubiquinol oxidase subunit II